ncbi:unnamed protein product [Thlaspi arvense]|uniref:Gnk2-homologous domain-containing protein n=1 Tax=Thlaspi arvense TaxID=13288 RepID=A0AAU9RJY5_THLAR|nr:unnamed protein product [Thlaspi arvense]
MVNTSAKVMSTVETMIFISVVVIGVVVARVTKFPSSPIDTFVYYHHCSQPKYFPGSFIFSSNYSPGSSYESDVKFLLNSLADSASLCTYNHFIVSGISGMYQCRGDLSSRPGDCARCVARAVRILPNICGGACGGALLLEGCFVEYEKAAFLGVANKTVLAWMCGTPSGYNSGELALTNALVSFVVAYSGKLSRVASSGEAQAVAQCTGDLSARDCQECLMEAKSVCGTRARGDVHLAKCYLRYSSRGATGHGYKNSMLAPTQRLSMDGSNILFYRIRVQQFLINE